MSAVDNRRYRPWSSDEIHELKILYLICEPKQLTDHFRRPWNGIVSKALSIGLYRSEVPKSMAKLGKLLDGSHEANYWIGFLLADGHFTSKDNGLSVAVAPKDRAHLTKFAEFIASKVRETTSQKGMSVIVSAKDRYVVPEIRKKFGVVSRKTYQAPLFGSMEMTKDELVSIFLGIFDGDGCVHLRQNGDFYGRVRMHSSWIDALSFFQRSLCETHGIKTRQIPKINNAGYVEWALTISLLRVLRSEGRRLNLPVLERKWSKVT